MERRQTKRSRDGTVATRWGRRLVLAATAAAIALASSACGAGADYPESDDESFRSDATAGVDAGGASDRDTGGGPPPEQEEEFEFSAPAVVGGTIYVANETLNAVAAIDTKSLSIETIPVGFRPTKVVGPAPKHAGSNEARVMVLNTGSASVSVIDPSSGSTETRSVMRGANALKMDPTGRFGVVWYDDSKTSSGDRAGDLSSVSVVTSGATHQVAVGFHVRDVVFSADGKRALVWTDDGVSRIELTKLQGDTVAAPLPLIPTKLSTLQPAELEIQITRDANHVVTRSRRLRGIVLLDVENEKYHVVPTFEVPSDVDLIRGTDPSEVLVMLRSTNRAIRAEVPKGLVNAANALSSRVGDITVSNSNSMSMHVDAGMPDTGATDSGVGDGGATDTGPTDTGAADTGASDTAPADTGPADTGPADTGPADPDSGDGTGGDADAAVPPETFPQIDAFEVLPIQVDGLGSASVGADGTTALLYTTVGEERRVVMLDLEQSGQRVLALQKKVRGALSDERGDTFIVFNQKQPGEIPPGATPTDPEYVKRSWGITLIDVGTATTRLMLAQHEPGPTALWSPSSGDPKVFSIFAPPSPEITQVEATARDVIEANLRTFRTETHRLPSIPEGLGPVAPAGKIFVSQRHPQGRMTFIDATEGSRQTITGYQLNSEID